MNNPRKQKGGQLNSTVKVAVQNIFDHGREALIRTRSHTKIHVDEFKNVLKNARQRRTCRNKHCRNGAWPFEKNASNTAWNRIRRG